MRLRLLFALSLIAAAPSSGIDVARRGDRVLIHATSSTLVDVLSRFAEATGAEVVYEAARPRQLVTVSIDAHSEAEALAQLLEGQGLNYALRLDAEGRRVQMLVISGTAAAVPSRDAPAAHGRTPTPAPFQPIAEDPEDEGPEQDPGGPPDEGIPASTVEPPPFASPGFLPGSPATTGAESVPANSPNVPPGSPPLVQPPQTPFPASYPPHLPPGFPGPASYPTPRD